MVGQVGEAVLQLYCCCLDIMPFHVI